MLQEASIAGDWPPQTVADPASVSRHGRPTLRSRRSGHKAGPRDCGSGDSLLFPARPSRKFITETRGKPQNQRAIGIRRRVKNS